MTMSPGVNIFSGAEDTLGAALTNPTVLSRQKGKLTRGYPILFNGKRFPDAESAYQVSKGVAADRDEMMIEVIAAKLRQHPNLAEDVKARGGSAWLAQCSHLTGAKSEAAQSWEGVGTQSRFIRNLIAGYEAYLSGVSSELGQHGLF